MLICPKCLRPARGAIENRHKDLYGDYSHWYCWCDQCLHFWTEMRRYDIISTSARDIDLNNAGA